MIQELFIGSGGEEETKISINGERGLLLPSSTTSLTSTPTPSSTPAVTTTATSSNPEKLRCPRCDSSNTKFCYYNNYNLTQPRHFCKTCRRYWTKGGALRNVPIGGGCRKNRSSGSSNSAAKTSLNKMKAVASELGRSSGLGLGPGLDHGLPQSPIIWGSPQNSHLLALLRTNQNPNTEPLLANELVNPRALSYNDNGVALCNSLRENQVQNNGFFVGGHQNSGIQEIYHNLIRSSSSSSSSLDNNSSTMFFGNLASTSSRSLSNFSELSSVSGSEFGCWNPTLSIWSDLPRTNGSAYP